MIAPTTQRVIERLVYEGLLLHNQWTGRRWRVTLADLLRAGDSEPRVWGLLPGILLHRPTMIFRLRHDLPSCPELTTLLRRLPTAPAQHRWRGVTMQELRTAADRIATLQQHQRRSQRWRNINIRISETDLQRLDLLATQHKQTKSALLRTLIARAKLA